MDYGFELYFVTINRYPDGLLVRKFGCVEPENLPRFIDRMKKDFNYKDAVLKVYLIDPGFYVYSDEAGDNKLEFQSKEARVVPHYDGELIHEEVL
jgi:hypothetical protein